MNKTLKLNDNEVEMLKALLDYIQDESRFVAALDKADLGTDDDRDLYEKLLDKVYKI